MRAEAGDNLKKLLEVEKRLFLSTEDLKIQHTEFVQVGKGGTMFFASCFQIALNLLSKAPKSNLPWTRVCGQGS